jgi:hypothetical protein
LYYVNRRTRWPLPSWAAYPRASRIRGSTSFEVSTETPRSAMLSGASFLEDELRELKWLEERAGQKRKTLEDTRAGHIRFASKEVRMAKLEDAWVRWQQGIEDLRSHKMCLRGKAQTSDIGGGR